VGSCMFSLLARYLRARGGKGVEMESDDPLGALLDRSSVKAKMDIGG